MRFQRPNSPIQDVYHANNWEWLGHSSFSNIAGDRWLRITVKRGKGISEEETMRFKNLASIDRIDFIVVHSDVGPVDVNNTWDVIPTAYQFVRDGELGEPIKTTSKGFQIRCFQWFADQTDGSVEDKSRAFTEDINELPFSNRKLPFIIHEGYLEDPSIYNAVE